MPQNDTRAKLAVPVEKLRRTCAPVEPAANSDPTEVIGQETAMASIELGLKMSHGDYARSHYNIAVVGPRNTGRRAKTLQFLRQFAQGIDAPPADIVCLPDTASTRRPFTVRLPNGAGQGLARGLTLLGEFAADILPQHLEMLREQMSTLINGILHKLWSGAGERTKAFGYVIVYDAKKDRRVLSPISLKDPKKTMNKEEYEKLEPDIRAKLEGELYEQAHAILDETQTRHDALAAAYDARQPELENEFVEKGLAEVVEPLRARVGEHEAFGRYLAEIVELIRACCLKKPGQAEPTVSPGGPHPENEGAAIKRLCVANLLVDNAGATHPPVVCVPVPQFSELFGRINGQMTGPDSMRIDHTMVEAGGLLKANGGYLVVDLEDLIRWGGGLSFYKLLKVIRTRQLVIETKSKFADAESALDYQTQEIPVDVRVIVICDGGLDHRLRHIEPEFENLFRTISEFDDELDADDAPRAYSAFVELSRQDGDLPEFTPAAVAKLVEYGCRRADGQKRASAEFGILKDVITEAAYWSKQAGADQVQPQHVERAVKARFDRQSLAVRRYLKRWLGDGMMLFETEGAKVGQINAMAVLGLSDEIKFGIPKRVTARAYAGSDQVVLVQRDVGTSGSTSNMAIGIISGYLSGKYGRQKALELTVQLCFEQCYGGIDGDSASLAEMVALVSAITELPVDQRLAITGSMNQMGEAQPIGGANEKIEGHFEAIRLCGRFAPGHGFVLPARNLGDLMLKDEVIEAQRNGVYQIYAVNHVDEALEIFLGRPAAEIHALVQQKLGEIRTGKSARFVSRLRNFFKKLFRRRARKDNPDTPA